MQADSDFLFNLYKANLALCLKTQALLQAGRQQWLEMGARCVGAGIEDIQAEVERLGQSGDWQALAALPADAVWRELQRSVGNLQEAAQVAIQNQTAFTAGYQHALGDWQQASAQAISAAGNAMPIHALLKEQLQALGAPGLAAGERDAPRRPAVPKGRGKAGGAAS